MRSKSLTRTSATNPFSFPLHLLSSPYHPSTTTTNRRAISTTSPNTPPLPSSSNISAKTDASTLPHLTRSSEIHLISTSAKSVTHRTAVAIGHVRFSKHEPLPLIRQNAMEKGDVLAVARIAAIKAVKKTSDLIPLAHPGVPIEGCLVYVEPVDSAAQSERSTPLSEEDKKTEEALQLFEPIGLYGGVRIAVQVETTAKTGVEMEALTGVVGAALSVVDMCKAVDQGCVIDDVKVAGKKGGRGGKMGIWRKRPDDEGLKGLESRSKETDGIIVGTGTAHPVEAALKAQLEQKREEEEKVAAQADIDSVRKTKKWKKWTSGDVYSI